jgi:hypothetical protein
MLSSMLNKMFSFALHAHNCGFYSGCRYRCFYDHNINVMETSRVANAAIEYLVAT